MDLDSPTLEGNLVARRKTSQEIAEESLAIAKRVKEKADARVLSTKAAAEKAVTDAAFAGRKVAAAQLLVGEDDDVL